jgi:hypothetical protein
MKIYISKAERLGILKRGEHNALYMQSGTFVGNTIDEAVVYFSKDGQSYTNIIQPEVNKLSMLPEDDMNPNLTEKAVNKMLMSELVKGLMTTLGKFFTEPVTINYPFENIDMFFIIEEFVFY